MKYDYLIVGAGLYGAVMAHELHKRGKRCLVIDRRDHIAGNIYCEEMEGIHVHKYGAHIFHTSNRQIWEYMNQFAEFNHYVNSPVAARGRAAPRALSGRAFSYKRAKKLQGRLRMKAITPPMTRG